MLLTPQVKSKIAKISQDRQLQLSCLRAMFQECERGTDLWEQLEEDCARFSLETRLFLWGLERPFEENEDEEDELEDSDCLFNCHDPYEIIDYLLQQVEDNLTKAIEAR